MNKFEFPLPRNAMYQLWLKLAQWFCCRIFLKVFNVSNYFVIISTSEKVCASFKQIWIFFTKACYVSSLVIGDAAVLENDNDRDIYLCDTLLIEKFTVQCQIQYTEENDTHWQRSTQSNNSYTDGVAHCPMTHTSTLTEMFTRVTQSLTEI